LPAELTRKLSFFRDCLDAESRAQTLWNVRNSKSEHLKDIDARVVSVNPARINISDNYADSLTKVLDRYWREKQLLLGRFFIVAYHDIASFGKNLLSDYLLPLRIAKQWIETRSTNIADIRAQYN